MHGKDVHVCTVCVTAAALPVRRLSEEQFDRMSVHFALNPASPGAGENKTRHGRSVVVFIRVAETTSDVTGPNNTQRENIGRVKETDCRKHKS